jgi:hypothetical protein
MHDDAMVVGPVLRSPCSVSIVLFQTRRHDCSSDAGDAYTSMHTPIEGRAAGAVKRPRARAQPSNARNRSNGPGQRGKRGGVTAFASVAQDEKKNERRNQHPLPRAQHRCFSRKNGLMAYRFQPLKAAFRSLAPALQAPQRKAGTPQCKLLPAAHTGRRAATGADSNRKTAAQALAELSATGQPRELQAVVNAIQSGFEAAGSDMSEIRGEVAELRAQFYAFRESQLRENDKSLQTLSTIIKGLGLGFEGFNAAWLQRMLAASGHSGATVQRRVIVPDPERTVHSNASMVEIDLLCKDPLVLVEATTFLGKEEFGKLEKFARLGDLIAKREGKTPQMLFCTFGVHPRISSMVVRFCNQNNIDLLTDNVER